MRGQLHVIHAFKIIVLKKSQNLANIIGFHSTQNIENNLQILNTVHMGKVDKYHNESNYTQRVKQQQKTTVYLIVF